MKWKTKNNRQFSLRSVFFKVLASFGIILVILTSIYYSTYQNLTALQDKVAKLSEPDKRSDIRTEMLILVTDAESMVETYYVNPDSALLDGYDRSVLLLNAYTDTLYALSRKNQLYLRHTDSLITNIDNKLILLNEKLFWNREKKDEDGIEKALSLIERRQKKSTPDILLQADSEKKRGNFFSRVFTSKEKQEAELRKEQEEKLAIIKTKSRLREDSLLTLRLESLLTQAKNALLKTTEEKFETELNYLNRDKYYSTRIQYYSGLMEKMEISEMKSRLNESTDETKKSVSGLLKRLFLTCLVILLFFTLYIYRDIRLNNRLKKQLITSRQHAVHLAKVKEEFLANMSHEIRTPMNIIMGFSEQIMKTDLSNDQKKMIQPIYKSSQHLLRIINEILDYSKLEAGVIDLEKIAFSPHEMVSDVQMLLEHSAAEKSIVLRSDVNENVPEMVVGDSYRLKQILLNLVGNAIKFTEKGSIEIICEVKETGENEVVLNFRVKDTGVGIVSEKLPFIFNQFSQEDNTVTRKYGGTGLGLSISKKLVELQNGKIKAASIKNKGSEFSFFIPYEKSTELNKATLVKTKHTELKKKLEGKRILVVDDDKFNIMLAEHILKSTGASTHLSYSGPDAIPYIMEKKPDIVLMDIQMPGMSGLEVMKALKNSAFNAQTRFIAITGNATPGEKEKCFAAGIHAYISKPYNETELLQTIADQLK